MPTYGSPWLIAVSHVLHRLLVPRHSPCALCSLTTCHASLLFAFPRITPTRSPICMTCGHFDRHQLVSRYPRAPSLGASYEISLVQIFAVIRFITNYIPAYCSFFTCCLMSRLVALRFSSYNSRSSDCLHDLWVIPSIPVRRSLSEGSEPRRFSFELNFWFKKLFSLYLLLIIDFYYYHFIQFSRCTRACFSSFKD